MEYRQYLESFSDEDLSHPPQTDCVIACCSNDEQIAHTIQSLILDNIILEKNGCSRRPEIIVHTQQSIPGESLSFGHGSHGLTFIRRS